jgi:hypothetical protein
VKQVIALLFVVLVFGLWLFSSTRLQQSVGQDDATVQAQMTIVVQPTPSPTP